MSTQTYPMEDADVHSDGRVTIDEYIRNVAGLDVGDEVTLRLGGEAFNAEVLTKGRVKLPRSVRESGGITDGDTVDIEVIP